MVAGQRSGGAAVAEELQQSNIGGRVEATYAGTNDHEKWTKAHGPDPLWLLHESDDAPIPMAGWYGMVEWCAL